MSAVNDAPPPFSAAITRARQRHESAGTAVAPDQIPARLTALRHRLDAARPTNIGFPPTLDLDITPLLPFFADVLNNVGVRCPMLRVDPKQRPRLIEIIRNLDDRVTEARLNGWHGEVQGLQVSLEAARAKIVNIDRATTVNPDSIIRLGLPVLRGDR